MVAGEFWVIETNYKLYALIYGCSRQRDDGSCDVTAEFAYVISRRRTMPGPLLRRVNYIIRHRLCIDTSLLQFTNHSRTYHDHNGLHYAIYRTVIIIIIIYKPIRFFLYEAISALLVLVVVLVLLM